MNKATEIYDGIAKILIGFGPEDAKMLIYSFIVQSEGTVEEGAVYRHKFDYVNKNNETNWFGENRWKVTGALASLALQLRLHIESETKSKWKSMIFQVDIEKQSFKVDFSYE